MAAQEQSRSALRDQGAGACAAARSAEWHSAPRRHPLAYARGAVRRHAVRAAVLTLCLCGLPVAAELPAGRVGVYIWSGQAPPQARSQADELTAGSADLRRFGFGAARIFVGGRYDYVHPLRSPDRFTGLARPVTLAHILALPRFKTLLEHPGLPTIWLTAYPVFDYGKGPDEIDLRRPVGEIEWRQEYDQLYEAVVWLYASFGSRDKVILISNHEADEKLLEVLNAGGAPELALGNVARTLEVRFRAVSDARRKFPAARLKVFFGAEISLWKLKLAPTPGGKWIKGGQGWNALEAVLPRARFDFVSFSAWEIVAQSDVAAGLRAALDDIGRRTRPQLSPAGKAFFGDGHVLIGEFGYAREWKLPPGSARNGVDAFVNAVERGRVPYAIYWQLYDNTEGDVKGFGLVDGAGKITCSGLDVFRRLRPAPPPPGQVSCRSGEFDTKAQRHEVTKKKR